MSNKQKRFRYFGYNTNEFKRLKKKYDMEHCKGDCKKALKNEH